MRHDRKQKLRIKRAELADWWRRQRVLPVALGVYFGVVLAICTVIGAVQ